MFIGHIGVAFALKRVAPTVNLGVAVAASSLPDIVWPLLLATGVETVRIAPGATRLMPLDFAFYPYSHSLLAALFWAVLAGVLYRVIAGSARAATWIAVVVTSHWLLDVAVHTADLPLAPGIEWRLGIGLWNSLAATLVVEGAVFAGGVWCYWRATQSRDRLGNPALWGLVALLVAVYGGSLFGPPPPDATAIVIADLLGAVLTIAWAAWIERHRDVRPAQREF